LLTVTDWTDQQVVSKVLAGETQAFELLMRRHNQRVYRAVRSLLRDEAEVEDAMQAAYLHAYSKLSSFRAEARFGTWLVQIALNEALGRLRRDRRHPSVDVVPDEESAMSPPVELPPSPETQASRRELGGLLERAIDALPDLYRVVFMLREVEGLDTAETALALQLSDDVVKTRLMRARGMLREGLEQLVGASAREVFGFHATRCDRVVKGVMAELALAPRR
jgi:RNA polymerase sigma-70 factor (ECF subfamily)